MLLQQNRPVLYWGYQVVLYHGAHWFWKVMDRFPGLEGHGTQQRSRKVLKNDDNVMEFLQLHWEILFMSCHPVRSFRWFHWMKSCWTKCCERLVNMCKYTSGFIFLTVVRRAAAVVSLILVCNAFISHIYHHNRFTALFLGPPRWAGARRELLDFTVQGEINRGRYTDNAAGATPSWFLTNQCPPPPPIFFTGRMPFQPPNQQCQSTEGN